MTGAPSRNPKSPSGSCASAGGPPSGSACSALGWWALFILAVAFAPDILATAVGNDGLTLAYLLGLTQVPMTFAVLSLYVKRADGRLDQLERTTIAAAEGVR
jgi:uncharacterized membrane protein (DUF485 family)